MNLKGAKNWNPRIVHGGEEEPDYQIRFTCPNCNQDYRVNIQSPPWLEPIGVDDPDFERRRQRNQVDHVEVNELSTQLWCHRCGIGGDMTLISQ